MRDCYLLDLNVLRLPYSLEDLDLSMVIAYLDCRPLVNYIFYKAVNEIPR